MKENNSTFFPPQVIHDTGLTAGARLLYGVIFTQAMATGYCYATNYELGVSVCVSGHRAQEFVRELDQHGYIRREVVRNKKNEVEVRRLYPLVG